MEKVYLGKSKLLFSFLDIYNSKVKTKHLMEMSSRTKVFFLLLQSPVLAIYKLNHITIYFRFSSLCQQHQGLKSSEIYLSFVRNLQGNKARDQKQIYRLNKIKSHWGLNPPSPIKWDTSNTELFGPIFVPCGRRIKI